MTIRIVIADDYRIVREGLRLLIRLDPMLEITGEAGTGKDAIRLAKELRPDIVLMDILLPQIDGVTAAATIRAEVPETKVLFLTGVPAEYGVVEAAKSGAVGYLSKDLDPEELRCAITAAAAGRVQFSPEAETLLLREVQRLDQGEMLTERETAVLRLLAAGKANKEIAHGLSIGEATVKSHVRHVLSKLGVESRTQAALLAVQSGLVRN